MKHFAPALSNEQQSELVTAMVLAITRVTGCDAGVISIALEPIDPDLWKEQVYLPDIINRKQWLCKIPDY